jgi:hypothetical protein
MAALAVQEESQLGAGLDAASVQNTKILDTPRTREACKALGLVIEDLHYRPFENFHVPGDMKEKQQMRFEHFERRRKEQLAQVLAERANVIVRNAKKGEVPGVQSAQFLSMLESLFEKEAKRLETDLKNQLRSHSSLVKENEVQLKKEEDALRREETRLQRRTEADRLKSEVGEKTREKCTARLDANAATNKKIKDEFLEKQVKFGEAQKAEKYRLARFMEEKGQMSAEKSAHWKARVEGMKVKHKEGILQRREEGLQRLDAIEAKIGAVTMRRDQEQTNRQIRSEEQHLHIMDVRSQKDRIDRCDTYKRDKLKDEIDGNVERIETLLALKDQLLEQRKARTSKAEATKGSRGLNLRRDCLPGPGQYEMPTTSLQEMPVMKMAKSSAPDFIDQTIKATRDNPPPGNYDSLVLPSGQLVGESGPSMVNFGNNKRTSFLDEAMKAKEFVPAPGQYKSGTSLDKRTTKFRRESIENQGLDKFSAKRYPIWARPSTQTPGPAGYNIDEYTRKEVLRRAQKSLPNLTKDMLRPGAMPSSSK